MALTALIAGVKAVARHPVILIIAYAATVLVVAPCVILLTGALARRIPSTPLAEPDARSFPLEAWGRVAEENQGLVSTFTPEILGLAAPLQNLTVVADAAVPPPVVLAAAAVYAGVWVLLWGGVLDAFAHGPRRSRQPGTDRSASGRARQFVSASARSAPPIARLMFSAWAVYALLLLVLHPVIGWMNAALTADAGEPAALLIRFALYGLAGVPVLVAVLVVDYARAYIVVRGEARVRTAVGAAARLIRAHPRPVFLLLVLTIGVFGLVVAGYAGFEVVTRGVPRAWSAILIGQFYVIGRLAARLIAAAAQVTVLETLDPHRGRLAPQGTAI
jgi:hypothetical protein